ncbi:hypothetical protein K9M78_00990 [Candidatus Bipolaricaulota bacterium]|nr:hypothetical protein [Candidatus Bipolaricaulota bacterium]
MGHLNIPIRFICVLGKLINSLQNHAEFFIGAVISIVVPSILILLIISDFSFTEILQYIYARKFVVLSLAVLNSVFNNLDGDQIFLLRENILPGALIGAGVGYLIVQVLSESY